MNPSPVRLALIVVNVQSFFLEKATMPIYEYEILNHDGNAKGVFETTQKMSEPALTQHPITGEPVRRILSRTFISSGAASSADGDASDSCASGACGIPTGGCASGACGWD